MKEKGGFKIIRNNSENSKANSISWCRDFNYFQVDKALEGWEPAL